jgi:hypothetical protein
MCVELFPIKKKYILLIHIIILYICVLIYIHINFCLFDVYLCHTVINGLFITSFFHMLYP